MAEEKKKIPQKDHQELVEIGATIERLHTTIGSMEVQKNQLIAQSLDLKSKIEEKAKACLNAAGIEDPSLSRHRIDLETGEVVEMPEPKKQQ